MTTNNIFRQINGNIVKLVLIPAVSASLALAARILALAIFIGAGFSKLGTGYAGAQAYMASVGLSGELLPLVIGLGMGGGLALLLGFQTCLAAFAVGFLHRFRCVVSLWRRPDAADHVYEKSRDGRWVTGIYLIRCGSYESGWGNTDSSFLTLFVI